MLGKSAVACRSRKPFSKPVRSRRGFCRAALLAPILLAACDQRGGELNSSGLNGLPLPAVDLLALDGSSYRLASGIGPCLINFWATWCPPCRAEMASLNRLYGHFSVRGLRVFGVSVDEDLHLVREYLLKETLDFSILLDPGAKAAKEKFGVAGFPTTFLVDRESLVRESWVGERDWDAPPIKAAIAALIGG